MPKTKDELKQSVKNQLDPDALEAQRRGTTDPVGTPNNPSHEILTVEGYRETARFEALSKAFADLSAVQCGFCIPGMILAAEALLSKNAHPTEQEVRTALSGNICRCTGYNAIVNAVLNAAKEGDGLW